MRDILLKRGRVVTEHDGVLENCDLLLSAGMIKRTEPGIPPEGSGAIIDLGGKLVLPGFVDMHTHGARLFDFTVGLYEPETGEFVRSARIYQEHLERWSWFLASTGATRAYPATFAASVTVLKEAFRNFRTYRDARTNDRRGALLAGVHLEGTFINPAMAGAQDPGAVLIPTVALMQELNEEGIISIVNVAPERGDEAFAVMRYLSENRVLVGAGHSDATGDQIREAVDAGLKFIVHFLNGPIGDSYKPFHGGGAVEAVLRDDRICVEQVCDGYHVRPEYVREVLRRKPVGKVVVVTDGTFVTGSPQVREFAVGGKTGQVAEGGKYLKLKGTRSTLFGSTLTMDRAFANLLTWLTSEMEGIWHVHLPALDEATALETAARVCATNAADLLGLTDTGRISEGKRADLVAGELSSDADGYQFTPSLTIVGGRIVFEGEDTSTGLQGARGGEQQ